MARDDVPVAVEILDTDGSVIGSSEAPSLPNETTEPSAQRRLSPLKIAAIVLIGAAAAAVAVLLTSDETEPAVLDPLPFFSQDEVDVGGRVVDIDYPLFGREWDFEILVQTGIGSTLRALDPNTGDTRVLAAVGGDRAFLQSATWLDDQLFISNGSEIRSYRGGDSELVAESGEAFNDSSLFILGNFWTHQGIFSGTNTLTHLATGVEVELDGLAQFIVIGDDILGGKGGTIVRIRATGETSTWARGEILTGGPSGITWRECFAADDCDYWAGTLEDPKSLRLDEATSEANAVLTATTAVGGANLFGQASLVSPSLRYAVTIDDFEDGALPISLVDLQTGQRLRLTGAEALPTFSPDERVILLSQAGMVIAVDTETGETSSLGIGNSSPFFDIVLIPSG